MSVREDGSAGLRFLNDFILLLNTKWKSGNTKRPTISTHWERKVTGLASRGARDVLINLDDEAVQIFSLQSRDENGKPSWDWLHDIGLSIEVRTATTIEDALSIVSEITRIIKENVTLVIGVDDNEYVQMLPGTVTSRNEEFRNLFRYVMEVSVLKYNP